MVGIYLLLTFQENMDIKVEELTTVISELIMRWSSF